MITLISPAQNAELSILTDIQREFIKRELPLKNAFTISEDQSPYPWYSEKLEATEGISHPASVIFKWKPSCAASVTKLQLSLDPDFAESDTNCFIATVVSEGYSSEDRTRYATVTNLLSGTTYYWRVTADGETSETRSFSTVWGEFRPIGAEGLENVRDMGGRVNSEGRRIKQGLIFRGTALNDLPKPECQGKIGLRVMRDEIGIKTDIDLRWEAIGKYEYCPIGDHVNYHLFPIEAYHSIFNEGQQDLFRAIFELFADEKNYPIYYHCVAGADRTGTIGFLLDALLGMSEEEIIFNYNVTAMCDLRSWYHNHEIKKLLNILEERAPGLTLPEKLVYFLKHCGISDDTLNRIRSNLIED